MVAITRFCRILGTMLTNGVPLLQAMNIAKGATGSTLMADRISEAAESVREGKSLTAPLAVGGLFPEQVLAMALVVPLLALPQAVHYVLDGVLWRRDDTRTRPAQRRALGFTA